MTQLSELYIKNFAIIEELTIDFQAGFTVITGETGAGKSIIINAMNLTLGEQADISMIRSGYEKAIIKTTIELDDDSELIKQFCDQNEIPIQKKLVIERKLYSSGRSRAWINDENVNISTLKKLGNELIDLHGQHHHQALLNQDNHQPYLDGFGDYDDLLAKVEQSWDKLERLREKKNNLMEKHQLLQEKKDLWQFQYEEIEEIGPKEEEYEKLKQEKSLLENAEEIYTISNQLVDKLYEGETSFYNNIDEVITKIKDLNDIQGEFGDYLQRLRESKYLFQEISNSLSDFTDGIEVNPQRLDQVNERIYELEKLMKKYGDSLQEVLEYKQEIKEKLEQDQGLEKKIDQIEERIDQARETYVEKALKLTQKREKWAHKFEKELENILARLGIEGAKFEVKIEQKENSQGIKIEDKTYRADKSGIDQIEFMISTNPGEPLMPLTSIVSGGEVSRIMLAIKSILAEKDRIPILIFDEIDTGISGKIGRIVGEEIKKLSRSHQILCITHLGQIAGLGDDHLAVRKVSTNGRSKTVICRLEKEQRAEEIASMIGGRDITDSALAQARQLLES